MIKLTFTQTEKDFFQDRRLIYFADGKTVRQEAAKESSDKDEVQRPAMTPDREKKCQKISAAKTTGYGAKIAERFKSGYIDEDVFEELCELIGDPNRLKSDSPQEKLVKAVAQGAFPKRGRYATTFLKALEHGGPREKKYVQDLMSELIAGRKLTSRTEKAALKEMKSLRLQDSQEQQKEKTDTGTAATTLITMAETQNATEKITSSIKEAGNINLDELSEGHSTELSKILSEKYKLAEASKRPHFELLEEQKKDKPDSAKIERLQKQLRDIDAQLAVLEKREDLLFVQIGEQRERIENLLTSFVQRVGVDLNRLKALLVYGPDLHKVKGEAVTLAGLVFNPQTGKGTTRKGVVTIKGLQVQDGAIIINYLDEEGNLTRDDLNTFKKEVLNGQDAHEDIQTVDELNQKVASKLSGAKAVAVGQTYSAVRKRKEKGEEIVEKISFTITGLGNGKDKPIKVDTKLVTLPRQWYPNAINRTAYFDKIEDEFSYGKFAKLLFSHNFRRENGQYSEATHQEIQDAVNGFAQERAGRCEAHKLGQDPRVVEFYDAVQERPETLTVPKPGETTRVTYRDKNGVLRQANLRVIPPDPEDPESDGEEKYEIEYEPAAKVGLPADLRDRIPEELRIPANDDEYIQAKPRKIVKNKLNRRDFIEAANKGEIEDTGATGNVESGEGSQPQAAAPTPMEMTKKKFFEEALPYDQVHKVGGLDRESRSAVKILWAQTRIFSLSDFWEMGKSMYEYYIRRFERRQKEKYSSVGKDLPFFAPEMQRINQAAENEQVSQFQESFDQKGVLEIQGRLRKTRNRDELKAAFIALSNKGQIRWDDIGMWKNLNSFVDPNVAVPIPRNGDPNTQLGPNDPRTGFDFLKDAIDSLWGEGQYNEWYSKTKSTYLSNAKGYYEEGKQLEGTDGGHEDRLATLLRDHKEGRFVDPQEFEGLILHAIEAGKSSMQTKIYYMIAGVAAKNSDGRTILSFDRMAHINSEMLVRFPILEYITGRAPRPDGGVARWTIEDYKRWLKIFDDGDPTNFRPTKRVDEFMWKYIIPSDHTQNRINKAIRDGERIDHDDMFAYLPPATEQIITDACTSTTGNKKFVTVEGYANVFPGFSQYLRSLAENNNRQKLVEGLKSYVRFSGIMTDRFEKGDKRYQRLDAATMNSATIVSATPPKSFMTQIDKVVENVVLAYGNEELINKHRLIMTRTGDIHSNKQEQELQNRINYAFKEFGDLFHKVVKSDNGAKMTAVVNSANLEGMPYQSDAEKDKRKADFANELELSY